MYRRLTTNQNKTYCGGGLVINPGFFLLKFLVNLPPRSKWDKLGVPQLMLQ
jgi:hypothetical protein